MVRYSTTIECNHMILSSDPCKVSTNSCSYRTCPKCAFIGFVDGDYPTLTCISCHVTFCTACNEPEHQDKTCEQVKQDNILAADPVHRAHEMMSQAVKRVCPGCKQTFQKLDGCNKITCSCGVKSCYMCGQKVNDYSQ